MLQTKAGMVVPNWDALRADQAAYARFVGAARAAAGRGGLIVLSTARTAASSLILRDDIPLGYLADTSILSEARLQYLTGRKRRESGTPRFGLIVSNGYGLGHVARMKAFAAAFRNYGPVAFMSYSAALSDGAYYLPSAQYLGLPDEAARLYGREASLQFFKRCSPTHVVYDGNILPSGLLSALAARPDIHLTWIRRGHWQADTSSKFIAQQALTDLVIEPGDVSDAYDAGPTWNARLDYCPPRAFLKIKPVRPYNPAPLERDKALRALKLDPSRTYILLMLGAARNDEDRNSLMQCAAAVREAGHVPVIAHWPMSQSAAPDMEGAVTIECMPIAQFYNGFKAIISAAGYNSFHEILGCDVPAIFVPQEDEGRDGQLARAQWAFDHGYAAMCRRSALNLLPQLLEHLEPRAAMRIDWHDDWYAVLQAMEISRTEASTIEKIPSGKISPRLFKKMHKRFLKKSRPFKTEFVLALDVSTEQFLKKKVATTSIIVTNSIDPIALRRAGYHYLWVNGGSDYAIRRQILNWLAAWRPGSLKSV